MNLPNKITVSRIILSIIILTIMVFPFYQVGVVWPNYMIDGRINVSLKYILCAVLFVIASVTDSLDGYIARKYNLVTDFGKVMDAIADKILVNGLLVVLSVDGFIPAVIPVIIITRDIFVDSIKMVASTKGEAVGASILGKLKTICMMCGVTLTLIYNLPFELIGINISLALLVIACILSVVSGVQYFINNKKYISNM